MLIPRSYQNHRRYVMSVDTSQLRGSAKSAYVMRLIWNIAHATYRSDLDGGDCKPITSQNGKPYYPCGLIANSVFNGG